MRQMLRPHRRVAADGRDGADHRRERHRQGAGRARAPRAQPAQRRPVRRHQLRGDARALLESELFGHAKRRLHRRASSTRRACSCRRSGGTLFLDEIGEHAARAAGQAAARAQDANVRAGRRRAPRSPIDVRLVAATNRDLESDVEDRPFREDLFYRINVIHDRRAAAARRAATTCCCWRSTSSSRLRARNGKRVAGLSPARRRAAARLRLAGQRARAPERHRARGRR